MKQPVLQHRFKLAVAEMIGKTPRQKNHRRSARHTTGSANSEEKTSPT